MMRRLNEFDALSRGSSNASSHGHMVLWYSEQHMTCTSDVDTQLLKLMKYNKLP